MRILIVLSITMMLTGSADAGTPSGPSPHPQTHCFSAAQFEGWRAENATTIYVRANVDRYYRIELAHECTALKEPDAQLILGVHGSRICSATDVILKVRQPLLPIAEPCFIRTMTELSAGEAAAIPHNLRP